MMPQPSPAPAARRFLALAEPPSLTTLGAVDWGAMPPGIKRYPPQASVAVPQELCFLLRNSYGLTRYQWDSGRVLAAAGTGASIFGRPLRPVPSGGGLSSGELYLIGAPGGLPQGAYHYDPAAEALDPVRYGAEPGDAGLAETGLCLLIGSVFHRTGFKYREFGYRLQCLDGGVLIGQLMAVAGAEGLHARVVATLDRSAADRMLGLEHGAETVLAAVMLTAADAGTAAPSAALARRTDPAPAVSPTRRTQPRSVLASMPLTAALCAADESTRGCQMPVPARPAALPHQRAVPLPPAQAALTSAISRRRSADSAFTPDPMTPGHLAAIARAGSEGWAGDIAPQHIMLFLIVRNVTDLDQGVYLYDPAAHRLLLTSAADVSGRVWQAAARTGPFTDHRAALVVYPIGDYEHGFRAVGDAWYRMQNLAAGISAQRVALAAAANGLGCRVTCSYDSEAVAGLMGLPAGMQPLCQILTGPVAGTAACTQPLHHEGG